MLRRCFKEVAILLAPCRASASASAASSSRLLALLLADLEAIGWGALEHLDQVRVYRRLRHLAGHVMHWLGARPHLEAIGLGALEHVDQVRLHVCVVHVEPLWALACAARPGPGAGTGFFTAWCTANVLHEGGYCTEACTATLSDYCHCTGIPMRRNTRQPHTCVCHSATSNPPGRRPPDAAARGPPRPPPPPAPHASALIPRCTTHRCHRPAHNLHLPVGRSSSSSSTVGSNSSSSGHG